MKAISLWQPWATAIALGVKTIETRHWHIAHRGKLLIHAAKKNTPELRDFYSWKCCDLIRNRGEYPNFESLPFGAIVAVCDLVECLRTTDIEGLTPLERDLGDYSPGRYGWILKNIQPLKKPILYPGSQGLFEVPHSVLTP